MKNIKWLPLLLMLGVFLVSCEKEQKKEWNKYYGYSNGEIVGSYSFSKVEDAFEDLTESAYCHICEDAKINITARSESIIEFNVNCPNDEFNRTFEGRPCLTDDDFLINMTAPSGTPHPDYELTVYVYKNDQGDIRLHGFARHIKYEIHNDPNGMPVYNIKSKVNYYFDVIKN